MLAPAVGSGAPANSKKRNHYVLHEEEKFLSPGERTTAEVFGFVSSPVLDALFLI